MQIFKILNGVINNIFSIGLKDNKTTFESTSDGLNINNNIDVADKSVRSSAVPTNDNDLVNLAYIKNQLSNPKKIAVILDASSSDTSKIILPSLDKNIIITNVTINNKVASDSANGTVVNFYYNSGSGTYSSNTLINAESLDLNVIGLYHYSMFEAVPSASYADMYIKLETSATTIGTFDILVEYLEY